MQQFEPTLMPVLFKHTVCTVDITIKPPMQQACYGLIYRTRNLAIAHNMSKAS